MSNVGRIIRDVYCNGYADNEYDMDGAEIVAEGEDWIVCRKSNGRNVFIDFQQWEWDRDERGSIFAYTTTCVQCEQRLASITGCCIGQKMTLNREKLRFCSHIHGFN
jgi:hypothetical protein